MSDFSSSTGGGRWQMGKEQAVIRIKELKWLRLMEDGNSLATAVPWGKVSFEHHSVVIKWLFGTDKL